MGFFNDFGKKTTETTNKIAREAKLKMKINENKSKINDLYEDIGKKYYENHIREEKTNIKELLNSDCSEIDKLSKEIEDARKEILILNNKKICKKCFTEIESDAEFCPKCGEKQNEDKIIDDNEEKKTEESNSSENNGDSKTENND